MRARMFRAKTRNLYVHLVLLVLFSSIVIGLIVSQLTSYLWSGFLNTRLIFLFLTAIAIFFIGLEIKKWQFYGLFSPLTWLMLGFVVFHFYIPITYPEYWNVYSFLSPFSPLILVILMGMSGLIIGYYLASISRWKWARAWLQRNIATSKLVFILSLFWLLYVVFLFITAQSGGYKLKDFIFHNQYLFGTKGVIIELFYGVGYYTFLLVRVIPIALFAPTVFCLWTFRPKWLLLPLVIGAGISIVFTINIGVRSAFIYTVGGGGVWILLNRVESKKIFATKNLKRVGYILGWMGLFYVIATVQFGFRYQRVNLIDLSINDVVQVSQAVKNVEYYQNTDQNFTLYRVLQAVESNTLRYLKGESYALTFVQFIPRRFWPNKPGGASMYAKLSSINPWRTTHDNVSYSYLGELIYNFGILSVVPGSLLFGWLAGIWWKLFLANRGSIKMQLLYAPSIMPFMFMVRGSFNAMSGRLLYSLLIIFGMLWLSDKKHDIIN